MRQYLLIFLAGLLCTAACTSDSKEKTEVARLVEEWQGKEIRLPSGMTFTRNVTDTLDWQLPETDFKVFVFVDSTGCVSCKLQLPMWKGWMASLDSVAPGKVSFLFVLQSKDLRELRYVLQRDQFDYPVNVDVNDEVNCLNRFPADDSFRTFLLDRNNRVRVIGNPVHNPVVKDLYMEQITGKGSSSPGNIRTTVSVDEADVDLGSIPVSETKRAVFIFMNTGYQPLVILNAATTCGCAAVSFDREPAAPGASLKVYVDMTPNTSGFFDETVTVKCNTPQQIKLKIRGQAT